MLVLFNTINNLESYIFIFSINVHIGFIKGQHILLPRGQSIVVNSKMKGGAAVPGFFYYVGGFVPRIFNFFW